MRYFPKRKDLLTKVICTNQQKVLSYCLPLCFAKSEKIQEALYSEWFKQKYCLYFINDELKQQMRGTPFDILLLTLDHSTVTSHFDTWTLFFFFNTTHHLQFPLYPVINLILVLIFSKQMVARLSFITSNAKLLLAQLCTRIGQMEIFQHDTNRTLQLNTFKMYAST